VTSSTFYEAAVLPSGLIARRVSLVNRKTPRPRIIHPRKRPNDLFANGLFANGLDTSRGVLYIIVALFRRMGGFIRIPPELSMSNMTASQKVLKAVKMGRLRKKAAGKARES
jgi:hypothetical protein